LQPLLPRNQLPAFLTAEWRLLAMLNYRVAPALIEPHVPKGTELDAFRGVHYASVVGFLFCNTRVVGVPVPFHRNFEEVNLRFYVRRTVNGEVRRAVVFIRELVPRRAIAALARVAYNEPYRAVTMRHEVSARRVAYRWKVNGAWTTLSADLTGDGAVPPHDSEEAFITEHYWGYTRQRDGGTVEYEVRHPRWHVWRATNAAISGSLADVYGDEWARALSDPPASAFVADGSPVSVHFPRRIS
jgi:uncharacterized protein YqjF (DUF2071 family)